MGRLLVGTNYRGDFEERLMGIVDEVRESNGAIILFIEELLEQNKQYIQEPPTVEKCNLLSKQLFYTRLARKEIDYVKHMWRNKQDLKVEDTSNAALFGLECFCWFCVGEIVGRRFTFTGLMVRATASRKRKTKMEADILHLGKIEEEIDITVKNLNEKEELILLKEKKTNKVGM
ncbi:hypothetical protein IFM89_024083 [Coptis chinensis]|uniref:Uncharacterized protein n=1 Tax=Coptis chinensis TaxID=261450 RepID=A0A835LV98_9MAGN|nr:hypothetical protein IFM89_024083 [Coptis chinensis]